MPKTVYTNLVGSHAKDVAVPAAFRKDVAMVHLHQMVPNPVPTGANNPTGDPWVHLGNAFARAAGYVAGGDIYRDELLTLRRDCHLATLAKFHGNTDAERATAAGQFAGLGALDLEPIGPGVTAFPQYCKNALPGKSAYYLLWRWLNAGGSITGWRRWIGDLIPELATGMLLALKDQAEIITYGGIAEPFNLKHANGVMIQSQGALLRQREETRVFVRACNDHSILCATSCYRPENTSDLKYVDWQVRSAAQLYDSPSLEFQRLFVKDPTRNPDGSWAFMVRPEAQIQGDIASSPAGRVILWESVTTPEQVAALNTTLAAVAALPQGTD